MIGDTVHGISEFGDFPWGKVKTEQWSHFVGGVLGDVDFNGSSGRHGIQFFRADGTADAWQIPDGMAELLEAERRLGASETAMRHAPKPNSEQLKVVNDVMEKVRDLLCVYDGEHNCGHAECSVQNPCCEEMRWRQVHAHLKAICEPKPDTTRPDRLTNPAERIMFDEWCKECESHAHVNCGWGALEHIMGDGGYPRPVTQHEHLVAGSVIQWLGTNCGAAFLSKCSQKIAQYKDLSRIAECINPWKPHDGSDELSDIIAAQVEAIMEYWPTVVHREKRLSPYHPRQSVNVAPACAASAKRKLEQAMAAAVACVLWATGYTVAAKSICGKGVWSEESLTKAIEKIQRAAKGVESNGE